MITNSKLTIYHKVFNANTKLEEWIKYNYDNVWFFGGKGSSTNKGYDNANDVQIRIPYSKNDNLDASHFEIGDIIVQGHLDNNIENQQDLEDYIVYNITSINNNNFGNNQHVHLSGK